MNKKIIVSFFFAAILLTAAVIFTILKKQEYYIEKSFDIGEEDLDNPARGFYIQLGTQNISLLPKIKKENNIRLVLTAFDIIAYRNCSIPEEKLQELDAFFTKLDMLGLQAIFRAAYGFDQADCNDADSMDRIEEHILQIAPILNKHKKVIYCVQAGFLDLRQ